MSFRIKYWCMLQKHLSSLFATCWRNSWRKLRRCKSLDVASSVGDIWLELLKLDLPFIVSYYLSIMEGQLSSPPLYFVTQFRGYVFIPSPFFLLTLALFLYHTHIHTTHTLSKMRTHTVSRTHTFPLSLRWIWDVWVIIQPHTHTHTHTHREWERGDR